MDKFVLHSEFKPTGDQPEAINKLVQGINDGYRDQVLLGVTGSGKTFTMANIIEKVNRPTLVLAHNKTLAAQLYSEFKEFFPDNCVEFFVSYYDYYQPEAYIAASDTYIEKDCDINDEIDRLRHSATAALFERRDVIIVASVSCIYGLGDPEDYTDLMISLRPGMQMSIDSLTKRLAEVNYVYDNGDFAARNVFRVRGDSVLIKPSDLNHKIIRVEFFGDEIERIVECDDMNFTPTGIRTHVAIFPASHYATTNAKMERALGSIREELSERVVQLQKEGKELEAYRLDKRTKYDVELLHETGFCTGIENYSRHISGRAPGSSPYTLIDYFPKDFLLFVDESHVTLPQVRAMYNGDRARKTSLIDYGFRLPSAYDNRPLTFEEFDDKIDQAIYVSATPAEYERKRSLQVVEQLIRPTGLLDPEIEVRPITGQIDNLVDEIRDAESRNERVLVTTLTKKMAESLTDHLTSFGIKVRYMHSEVKTIERMEIIRGLRLGEFDVLVGINLLREGLDIPEVSRVIILDADKTGFLRSEVSLIQTIGRAARNANGKVIMYADDVSDAMKIAIKETNRRRKIQLKYNEDNHITPKTITKSVRDVVTSTLGLDTGKKKDTKSSIMLHKDFTMALTDDELSMPLYELASEIERKMLASAEELKFEEAAKYRDMLKQISKTIEFEERHK